MAKQYEFLISEKCSGAQYPVYATARTVEIAHKAVVDAYGDHYNVSDTPRATREAHYFYGEINCM